MYKPVYPSIYMLHRMYICWEHARFSRVSPPPCVSQHGALAGKGALEMPAFPTQPPPAQASPCQSVRLSVRVLSSVHALIGLTQPPDGAALATSCTYDCKMVNVCIISGLVI